MPPLDISPSFRLEKLLTLLSSRFFFFFFSSSPSSWFRKLSSIFSFLVATLSSLSVQPSARARQDRRQQSEHHWSWTRSFSIFAVAHVGSLNLHLNSFTYHFIAFTEESEVKKCGEKTGIFLSPGESTCNQHYGLLFNLYKVKNISECNPELFLWLLPTVGNLFTLHVFERTVLWTSLLKELVPIDFGNELICRRAESRQTGSSGIHL